MVTAHKSSTADGTALVWCLGTNNSGLMPGLLTALLVFALLPLVSPAPAAGAGGTWPVANPSIVRGFTAPLSRFGSGHRGIDLAASPGMQVHAVASGVVHFAGEVAGIPTVSVSHSRVISSYQPVHPLVEEGTYVAEGTLLGIVSEHPHGHHSALHLGIRDALSKAYLNPLLFLAHQPRLISSR